MTGASGRPTRVGAHRALKRPKSPITNTARIYEPCPSLTGLYLTRIEETGLLGRRRLSAGSKCSRSSESIYEPNDDQRRTRMLRRNRSQKQGRWLQWLRKGECSCEAPRKVTAEAEGCQDTSSVSRAALRPVGSVFTTRGSECGGVRRRRDLESLWGRAG
jgi:hypothetical protein